MGLLADRCVRGGFWQPRQRAFTQNALAAPAYGRYLQDAIAAHGGAPGVAGISLQRQAARLDAYKDKKKGALAPLALPKDDGL